MLELIMKKLRERAGQDFLMLILRGTGIESFTVLGWEIVPEHIFFLFYAINISNI